MICTKCGARVGEDAGFCLHCGSGLAADAIPDMPPRVQEPESGQMPPLSFAYTDAAPTPDSAGPEDIKRIKAFNWMLIFSSPLVFTSLFFTMYTFYGQSGLTEWNVFDMAGGFDLLGFASIPLVLAPLCNLLFAFLRKRIPTYVFSAFILLSAGIYVAAAAKAAGSAAALGAGFYLLIGGGVMVAVSQLLFAAALKKEARGGAPEPAAQPGGIPEALLPPLELEERIPQATAGGKRFLASFVTAVCVVLASFTLSTQISRISAERAEQARAQIMEKYGTYAEVSPAENKAGISVEPEQRSFSDGGLYSINVRFSHPGVNQSQDNTMAAGGRMYVLDAETLDDVSCQSMLSTKTTTNRSLDQASSVEHSVVLFLNDKIVNATYVLVCFDGISKGEAEELETPPLFFVVLLDQVEGEVVTKVPLAMGQPFKK